MINLNIKSNMKSWVVGIVLGFSTTAFVAHAVVSHVYQPGDTLGADSLNTNFSELDARITALENSALPSQSQQIGYAWVSHGSAGPSISGNWSFNSSGGTNTVTQESATGEYTVTFPGLGNQTGGIAMASNYSDNNYNCHITGWSSVSSDVTVGVKCYSTAGGIPDSSFVVIYLR